MARTFITHSSSSTSTCPKLTMMLYDIQANKSASSVDTRLISRSGFKVDVTSSSGLGLRDEKTPLSEGVSSHQAALDLSAAQAFAPFDWFLTFTCNQSSHPGIKHLHAHKASKNWTKYVRNYNLMSSDSFQVSLCVCPQPLLAGSEEVSARVHHIHQGQSPGS